MPQITEQIEVQNFTKIARRIFDILMDEMPAQIAQAINAGQFDELDLKYFYERYITLDSSELPALNVTYYRSNYDSKNYLTQGGVYTYNIDVYTESYNTDDNISDTLAAVKIQYIMGCIRYILENHLYKTLCFTPPSLSSTRVTEIGFIDPNQLKTETTGQLAGRLVFEVVCNEKIKLITPAPLAEAYTNISIDNTNQGYLYLNS